MAGIDWFRWHHGSVTEPKFRLVAMKAGASVAEVVAVWATLLEAASQAEERGNTGRLDFDSIDCNLGLVLGRSQAIYDLMVERGLVEGNGQVSAWERRQPKREREDDSAAERKRAQRARQAAETQSRQPPATPDEESHVTPSHATSHQKTPREEKSREEKKVGAKAPPFSADAPEWVPAQQWADFVAMRKAMRGVPFTDAAAKGVLAELGRLRDAGHDPARALENAVTNGWRTVYAPKGGAGPLQQQNRQEALEQRNRSTLSGWVPPELRTQGAL